MSHQGEDVPGFRHHELPSDAFIDRLKISDDYSDVPPSPGVGRLHFVDGNLEDTMAAEFGGAEEGHHSLQTYGSSGLPDSRISDNDKIVALEAVCAEKSAVCEREVDTTPVEEMPNDVTVTISRDLSEVDGVSARRTAAPTVNEIEPQCPGPSTLCGDMLQNSENREGYSGQRLLAFAAKRHANAVQRNPRDYNALYNWALVLQESAGGTSAESSGAAKDQLLEEACAKYKAATDICPTLGEAFYNWAIAISDRAKARGRTKEAEDFWKEACKKYERAVRLNRNSPQAQNNWGLALQELSGIVSIKDKRSIVKTAIKKFRAAISLQYDFHRAIYNLGTVLYGLAEDTIRSGVQHIGNKELTAAELYSQSAIYVAAAHALKPEYSVYRSALRLVRSKLPLAYLKTGYLLVSPEGNALAPHSDWRRLWFVLDHEAFYQVDKVIDSPGELNSVMTSETPIKDNGLKVNKVYTFRIEIPDICGLGSCADLSLPPGAGFSIDAVHGQHYLIADTWEQMDCWVDALRLVYTIWLQGQGDVLAGIIAG